MPRKMSADRLEALRASRQAVFTPATIASRLVVWREPDGYEYVLVPLGGTGTQFLFRVADAVDTYAGARTLASVLMARMSRYMASQAIQALEADQEQASQQAIQAPKKRRKQQ